MGNTGIDEEFIDAVIDSINGNDDLIKDAKSYVDMLKLANHDGYLDEKFRRSFVGLYKVRRSKEFQDFYFGLFNKYADLQGEDATALNEEDREEKIFEIIEELKKAPGNIELSFATKMLSTIYADIPIWDVNIEEVIKKHMCDDYRDVEKAQNTLEAARVKYRMLERLYKELKSSGKDKDLIAAFDEMLLNSDLVFDSNEIPETKKIDYVLWAYGKSLINGQS